MQRPLRPCNKPGCPELTDKGYCEDHIKVPEQRRGSAHDRGYTYQWQKYSARFLKRPENAICKLQLDVCTRLARCVDHIDPPDGPKDPKFWDVNNHQSACIECNSSKGRKVIKGKDDPMPV